MRTIYKNWADCDAWECCNSDDCEQKEKYGCTPECDLYQTCEGCRNQLDCEEEDYKYEEDKD